MNNNLGHDKVAWSADLWTDIDTAVLAEVGLVRVAQKVLPSSPMTQASNVPADVFKLGEMRIAEGQTKPFLEISVEYVLTQSQVDNEKDLRTGRTLARMATKLVALAEDTLVFQGKGGELPPGVRVVNKESAVGLLEVAKEKVDVPLLNPGKPGVYGENTFKAVTEGISKLTAHAQPGPYALLLASAVYADTYAPLPTTLVTTADRITPLVTGGFYGTGTLPARTGLLISLGGQPTTVYVGQDAVTAYTQEDQEGNARFRVFERVQTIARDERAFVKLLFKE